MIESVIQKLDDLTIMGQQLKIEHDNCMDTLHAKLREHDLLINQLNNRTMMLVQEIADSSAGILRFYNEFLLHLSDSTEYIRDFKDMTSGICNNAVPTTASERHKRKDKHMSGRWTQKKNKGPAHGECRVL